MPEPFTHLDSEGDLHIQIPPTIVGVSIGNITQVRSHEIVQESGVTSHLITFRDGGVFRFLYRDDRRVLDLSGHHVCVAITPENGIVLYSYESIMGEGPDP